MTANFSDSRSNLSFLQGGGEMGARMRAMDWSQTALGAANTWPQSLRSTVSMLLPSKAQIIVFWGPEFTVLYNDAYRPVFGAKHPSALGLPGREAWSEIWDSQLHQLLAGVVRSGEAFWAKDLLFELEEFYEWRLDRITLPDGRFGVVCYVRDISAHKQALAAKAYLAAIVDSAEDAIISKDLNGTIQWCNAAAEHLFGYSSDELVGRPVRILIPPERQSEEDEILDRLRAGERIEHFETVRMTRAGRHVAVALTISPVRDESGTIIGASKIVRDVTAVKQAEAERMRLLRDHAEVMEALNNVGAIVASDLDRDKVVQAVTDAATELTTAEFGAFFYNVINESGESYTLYVLAVDDEADALALVAEVLQAAGARVSTAHSADAALSVLEAQLPDVVVADLGMPHVDGFQFIDRIRRHQDLRVRDVPAAALTAYARSEDRTKALASGFQIHLAKPIDPTELVTMIAALARRFTSRD
jgi:PAS domain S-box-containing protein